MPPRALKWDRDCYRIDIVYRMFSLALNSQDKNIIFSWIYPNIYVSSLAEKVIRFDSFQRIMCSSWVNILAADQTSKIKTVNKQKNLSVKNLSIWKIIHTFKVRWVIKKISSLGSLVKISILIFCHSNRFREVDQENYSSVLLMWA